MFAYWLCSFSVLLCSCLFLAISAPRVPPKSVFDVLHIHDEDHPEHERNPLSNIHKDGLDHSIIHVDEHHRAPDWGSDDKGAYRSAEYHLIRHLLRYYDVRTRPAQWPLQRMNITFGLALAQIIDVDEKNQLITTNCWLNTAWLDFQLTWNPDEWDGIEIIRLPFNQVWLPDVVLYNNADVMTYFSSVSTNLIVQYTGNVTWLNMAIYKSTCPINVQFFPFDIQNCSLRFSSWTYDGIQMSISTLGDEGDVSNYMENTEWRLLRLMKREEIQFFSCCPDEPYPFVTYNIIIRRRPLFYIYNLFMPCVLITFVALLGFLVPADSGEKVSMGITTLLSMTVFLMVVAESMPPTKSHVPLLGLYFGFTIMVVSCTTALTVLTLNIHYNGKLGFRMPVFLRYFLFKLMSKAVLFHVNLPNSPVLDIIDESMKTNKGGKSFDLLPLVSNYFCKFGSSYAGSESSRSKSSGRYSPSFPQKIPLDLLSGAGESTRENPVEKNYIKKLATITRRQHLEQLIRLAIEMEWRQAAAIVDRFILIIFLMANVIVTMTISIIPFQVES